MSSLRRKERNEIEGSQPMWEIQHRPLQHLALPAKGSPDATAHVTCLDLEKAWLSPLLAFSPSYNSILSFKWTILCISPNVLGVNVKFSPEFITRSFLFVQACLTKCWSYCWFTSGSFSCQACLCFYIPSFWWPYALIAIPTLPPYLQSSRFEPLFTPLISCSNISLSYLSLPASLLPLTWNWFLFTSVGNKR